MTFELRTQNEPIYDYAPGSKERSALEAELTRQAATKIEIPCIINGKEVFTGNKRKVVMPHAHTHVLAEFHLAGEKELNAAIEGSLRAKTSWERLSHESREKIFLKAADLLAGQQRYRINAATMLGQSKNVFQAEIDAACEMIDFLRFNVEFYGQIRKVQPLSSPGVKNALHYRPLEGFVLAITPFNFTAIAGNLCAAPALVGNTVIWKPSDTQMLSAYYTYKLFEEAGLPPGVIQFLGCDGPLFGEKMIPHRDMSGIHFTGSTQTFKSIIQSSARALNGYRSFPRIVGETGGKDFVFAHESADVDALAVALVRGAFEFQGQKCSAASRAYIPKKIWPAVKQKMLAMIQTIRMGDVRDFKNFMNAVIDVRSFNKIEGYLAHARSATDAKVIAGGKGNSELGYFVEPTVIETENANFKTLIEEIFGPVLTVYPYDETKFDETLSLCDQTSPYALTGAIFSQDEKMIEKMSLALKNAAGNFYINDKPTGAVVGQQPFGGARMSGTNDKAGSLYNLVRWISPQTVKRTLEPAKDYTYPFMR